MSMVANVFSLFVCLAVFKNLLCVMRINNDVVHPSSFVSFLFRCDFVVVCNESTI